MKWWDWMGKLGRNKGFGWGVDGGGGGRGKEGEGG
jgi:hypothetical protein